MAPTQQRSAQREAFSISLANFIERESILASVANGIDSINGYTGRDLDLYVPNPSESKRIIAFAISELERMPFDWVTPMPPLWGHICMGISTHEYIELHCVSHLRTGLLDFARLVTLEPRPGPNGLPVDPAIMSFKLVMKCHRRILRHEPLWQDRSLPPLISQNSAQTIGRVMENSHVGGRFLKAVFASDSATTIVDRRRLLLALMAKAPIDQGLPFTSTLLNEWLYKKMKRSSFHSTPYVGVVTDHPVHLVQAEMRQRLGHAFILIEARDHKSTWRKRRSEIARPVLILQISKTLETLGASFDLLWSVSDEVPLARAYDALAHAILDKTVQMNLPWRQFYA